MSFKPLTIILLLAAGYFNYNALAFPALVNPYAPSQTSESTEGSQVVLADVTPGSNGLATLGGDPLTGKGADPNGKTTQPTGKTDATKTATKAAGPGKSNKVEGLTQAELVEACAPLLNGKTGKNDAPALAKSNTPATGGKVDAPKNGGGLGGGKNATAAGKAPGPAPKKSSASIYIRSSVVTTALPIILSTGVGLLDP